MSDVTAAGTGTAEASATVSAEVLPDPRVVQMDPPDTTEEDAAGHELDLHVINSQAIRTRLRDDDFPAMQAIIDQLNSELRADPAQELKDIARTLRRVIRLLLLLLDGVE